MAQLSSILGGKPGRPGDMMKGIPPRPPRRHARRRHRSLRDHQSHRPRRNRRTSWVRRSRLHVVTRPAKIKMKIASLTIPRGSQIHGWVSDIRDYQWAGPQTWLRSRVVRPRQTRGPSQSAQARYMVVRYGAGNALGPITGPSPIQSPPRDTLGELGCLRYRRSQVKLF